MALSIYLLYCQILNDKNRIRFLDQEIWFLYDYEESDNYVSRIAYMYWYLKIFKMARFLCVFAFREQNLIGAAFDLLRVSIPRQVYQFYCSTV